MPFFNPFLLTLLRLQAGLSQAALCEGIGIKQAALSKYESGLNTPPPAMVEKLGNALGVLPEYFSRQCDVFIDGLIFHRKRSALGATERGKIEAEAKLRAIDGLELYHERGMKSDIPPCEVSYTPQEMALAVREHWAIPPGPITNVFEVLEQHGILLIEFDFGTDLLDGFFLSTSGNVICLVVNSNPAFPADRRRFSVLHELGHALLSEGMFPGKEAEAAANAFAAEFLAPGQDIAEELKTMKTLGDYCRLKSKWGMSIAALARRARDLDVYSEATYRRICIFLNSKGLRKQEPPCGVPEEHTKQLPAMLKEAFGTIQEPWKVFRLTPETFHRRYGPIMTGGAFG